MRVQDEERRDSGGGSNDRCTVSDGMMKSGYVCHAVFRTVRVEIKRCERHHAGLGLGLPRLLLLVIDAHSSCECERACAYEE